MRSIFFTIYGYHLNWLLFVVTNSKLSGCFFFFFSHAARLLLAAFFVLIHYHVTIVFGQNKLVPLLLAGQCSFSLLSLCFQKSPIVILPSARANPFCLAFAKDVFGNFGARSSARRLFFPFLPLLTPRSLLDFIFFLRELDAFGCFFPCLDFFFYFSPSRFYYDLRFSPFAFPLRPPFRLSSFNSLLYQVVS